jgi:pyruvate dehydrogenase E1 component alpha subunit
LRAELESENWENAMAAKGDGDATSTIRPLRCGAADVAVVGNLPTFAVDPYVLAELFRAMTLTRTVDRKAVDLQRTGRIGTDASSFGQQAIAVGVAVAMPAANRLLPSSRERGSDLWRGGSPEASIRRAMPFRHGH